MATAEKAIDDASRKLSVKAVSVIESLIASKLGNAQAFGESQVRLRFMAGKLTHVKVIDETDIK
jgi:hypothetical protein